MTETYELLAQPKSYVVGTQNNRLNKRVLLSTQTPVYFKLIDKEKITILHTKILLKQTSFAWIVMTMCM